MATKTVTIDTGEWIYIDKNGIPHTVTNAETFTLTLTDGGAAAVDLEVIGDNSMTTTDGGVLRFRRQTDQANTARDAGFFADANDGATTHNNRGEIVMSFNDDVEQVWRIAKIQMNNVDAPTAISDLRLEDQFGNVMNLPSTGSGWTVA